MTDSPRYTLVDAARRARMHHQTLADLIKRGDVPGATYLAPPPGGVRGTYLIFAGHFDRWIGVAEPEPAPAPVPFGGLVKTRRAS